MTLAALVAEAFAWLVLLFLAGVALGAAVAWWAARGRNL